MKSVFLILAMILSQLAFAGTQCVDATKRLPRCAQGEFLTNVSCEHYDQVRCTNRFTYPELQNNFIGRVSDTLVGELDPHHLGDGGVAYFEGQIDLFILEPVDQPYVLPLLQGLSKKGVVVGIPRKNLGPVSDKEAQIIKSLMSGISQDSNPAVLEILD